MGLGCPGGNENLDNASGRSGLSRVKSLNILEFFNANWCKRIALPGLEIQQRSQSHNQPLWDPVEMTDKAPTMTLHEQPQLQSHIKPLTNTWWVAHTSAASEPALQKDLKSWLKLIGLINLNSVLHKYSSTALRLAVRAAHIHILGTGPTPINDNMSGLGLDVSAPTAQFMGKTCPWIMVNWLLC